MKSEFSSKLEKLRNDYKDIKRVPFLHFYCPILLKDEKVQLCKAHVVNQAFPDSPRAWTVQRYDVDNFYGANFEADFVAIQYKDNYSLGDTITDKKLSKIFSPEILVDDTPVEYFFAKNHVPENFTAVEFDNDGEIIRLGIKLPPDEFLSLVEKNWEISTSKDVRVPALVSLIKAAHLALFEILGYRYAFSVGGYFVGRQILGEFFVQNHGKPKSIVIENSYQFFQEFTHMVRPVLTLDLDIQGTISDRKMFVCRGRRNLPWALIVFIRVLQSLHAVLIPVFDEPESVEMYLNFLKNNNESLDVSMCIFRENHWEIGKELTKLNWPKTGILYPEK